MFALLLPGDVPFLRETPVRVPVLALDKDIHLYFGPSHLFSPFVFS